LTKLSKSFEVNNIETLTAECGRTEISWLTWIQRRFPYLSWILTF